MGDGPGSADMRARRATLRAVAVLALDVAAIFVVFRPPQLTPPAADGRAGRAAVAIRDHVAALEEWGTREFTLPHLEAVYGRVVYLSQRARPTCEVTLYGDEPPVVRQSSDPHDTGEIDFVEGLTAALRDFRAVDVFLLAHTNRFVDWAERVPPDLRRRLRLVYNSGCYDLAQARRWRELGARAYVGHAGESTSSVFYFDFLRRWVRNERLGDALAAANARTQTYCRLCGAAGAAPDGEAMWQATRAQLTGDDSLCVAEAPR